MRPSTFQHDEKKKFQIKISQDGEFAMTFDAGKDIAASNFC